MARADATELILRRLAAAGPASRTALARGLGLADSTVSTVVAGLMAEGTLVQADADTETAVRAGRPALDLRLTRATGLAVGVDLGKSHARVAVADLAHAVLAERAAPVVPGSSAQEQIARVVGLVDTALADADAGRHDVVSVAMGLPGPVDRARDSLGDSTVLPGWRGVPARAAMAAALGLDVHIENDANLGALGEWTRGHGTTDAVLYVKIATGVGAGLIVDGELFTGARGTAGELGHTVVDPQGLPCTCGNRGCLETVAGAGAVLRRLGLVEDGGLEEVLGRLEDPAVASVLDEVGRAIGGVLGSVCNLLDPGVVIVGGTLAGVGEPLLGPLREALAAGAIARDAVPVVEGVLGERAEVLGALAYALRRALPRRAASTRP